MLSSNFAFGRGCQPMTAALYRTLRKMCGLSQDEAADFHGVHLRTIRHWEAGRNNPPPGAIVELEKLNAKIESAVTKNVQFYHNLNDGELPKTVDLYRYRTVEGYAASRAGKEGLPWGVHGELIGRTLRALRGEGARVNVEWGD